MISRTFVHICPSFHEGRWLVSSPAAGLAAKGSVDGEHFMLAECRSKAWMEAELGFGIWLFLFVFALFNGPAHCNSSKLAPLEFHGVASAENPTLYVGIWQLQHHEPETGK